MTPFQPPGSDWDLGLRGFTANDSLGQTMSQPSFAGSVPRIYHTYLGPLIFEDYAKDLSARLAPGANDRILELACGTGIVTRQIVGAMPKGATLTATDISPPMLEIAKQEVGTDPRVTFQAVDACSLPFAAASFDAIVCQYGVMFFPDKVKAMREARRVLKPRGRYIFNVWDSLQHNPIPRVVHETLGRLFPDNPPLFVAQTPYGWFDRAEIERVTRAGGFTNVTLEEVGFDCAAATAEDVARAWLEGTPLFPALQERGVTDLTAVRQTVTKELAARFGDKPCRSTIRAVVVTAA
ncbi:Demethylmenaquinone methyltransferase [Phycisphaerales bacterium]|nr:Demethylmenaquinone methyltransferase [Phycisphaerales bacterium]